MRWLVLLSVIACGGSQIDGITAAQTAACDFCPGATSVSEQTFQGGFVTTTCVCPSGKQMLFTSNPPIRECAHYQCEFAYVCAHGGLPFDNSCP